MFQKLMKLLMMQREDKGLARSRLVSETRPPLIYAVGDVHGCLEELQRLEKRIVGDAAKHKGAKWIIMLGDYVDRGPQSSQVLDHLMAAPPKGFERFCLAGNHEQLMLDFLQAPSLNDDWLRIGGTETLQSYGISVDELQRNSPSSRQLQQVLTSHIPEEHVGFLKGLPALISVPDFLFVHAGLRPGVSLEQQSDHDLMWIRGPFTDEPRFFKDIIVHGHTPNDAPEYTNGRVNVDTGAFKTGILTAARLAEDGEVQFVNSV